jgi:polar amino acid transport system substrate-binding protein
MPPADQIAAELATPGTLTACLALLGVPAAADDGSGEPVGYNVAFARELASRLGLTLELSVVPFDQLTTHLDAHTCDVSVSSQNITESRLQAMALTPYTQSRQPVVVRYGNPLGIIELADLCGRIVSAASGTTHVDFVNGTGDYAGEGLKDICSAAGQPAAQVTTFESDVEAVQALIAEEVAAYLGNPNFYYDFRDDLDIQGTPALPAARQGMATALDRPALTAAVEAALRGMIDDGTYFAILREHLLTEESVEAVSIVE